MEAFGIILQYFLFKGDAKCLSLATHTNISLLILFALQTAFFFNIFFTFYLLTPRCFNDLHFVQIYHKIVPIKGYYYFTVYFIISIIEHYFVYDFYLLLHFRHYVSLFYLPFHIIDSPNKSDFIFFDILRTNFQPYGNALKLPMIIFPARCVLTSIIQKYSQFIIL